MKFKDYICPSCRGNKGYSPEEYMFGDTEQMPQIIEAGCPACGGDIFRSVLGGQFHYPEGYEAVPRRK